MMWRLEEGHQYKVTKKTKHCIQEPQKSILIFVNKKKWAASTQRLQKSLYIKRRVALFFGERVT